MVTIEKLKRNRLLRQLIIWSTLSVVIGCPGYFVYTGSVKDGLRAEAQLMLSYIATLEDAYHMENGHYLEFENYGAALGGQENCKQPDGASRLGFQINWCAGFANTEPIRYAYKVEISKDKSSPYVITATSGSDKLGKSFICLGEQETDVWVYAKNQKKRNLLDCEVVLK